MVMQGVDEGHRLIEHELWPVRPLAERCVGATSDECDPEVVLTSSVSAKMSLPSSVCHRRSLATGSPLAFTGGHLSSWADLRATPLLA